MDNLKQLEDLHEYYDAMISGGYDGDDRETWETLHTAFLNTKEQIKALKLNGGNGKKAHEGNGGNGKEKPRSNGGNGTNPDNGKPMDAVTDEVLEEPAIYAQELG